MVGIITIQTVLIRSAEIVGSGVAVVIICYRVAIYVLNFQGVEHPDLMLKKGSEGMKSRWHRGICVNGVEKCFSILLHLGTA